MMLNLKWWWYTLITILLNVLIVIFCDYLLQTSGFAILYAMIVEFAAGTIAAVINLFYNNKFANQLAIGVALGSIASFILGFVTILFAFSGHVC